MSDYTPPLRDMWFVLNDIIGWDKVSSLPGYEEATPDLVRAILEEAGNLAKNVIAPTNVTGDRQGARLENGTVITADGFGEAYAQYVAGGWPSLDMDTAFGGQGLPTILAIAVSEMWQAANLAWSNAPLLSEGTVHALDAHGSDALKTTFLPRLVAGEWTGTMNLTEPQAGSDLALLRSTATPDGDHFKVKGQKIFITYGDHDMAENIVHLVLARLPDAPPGVRGISLFLVPKFLVLQDGTLGERNQVQVLKVEEKLGIHGSPTCVMEYDDATGYLVGEPHQGLACMFTMMNHARIHVGLQGLALAERAYQHALRYARERVQGATPANPGESQTIIHHADVRRMLMDMKVHVEAMRAVAYAGAVHIDLAKRSTDPATALQHQARVDLLTPIIKGWLTETAQVVTSLGVQIHGGMGFIEETGAAQHYRDARITSIYEGTTGIQAMDLIGRKVLRDRGAALISLLEDMRADNAELSEEPGLAQLHAAQEKALDQLASTMAWIAGHAADDPDVPGAIATPLLMLCGTLCGGWRLNQSALIATRRLHDGDNDAEFLEAKVVTARYYAEQVLPRVALHAEQIRSGSGAIMALVEDHFHMG